MSRLFKIILFCYIIFAFFLAQQRTIQISKAKTQSPYTVVVWSSDFCTACTQYKEEEVPRLEKLGYTVVVRDAQPGEFPEFVSKVPTIVLYRGTQRLKVQVYWKAKDIEEWIDG